MEYVEKKTKLITLDEEELEKIYKVANILNKLSNKMLVESGHPLALWTLPDELGTIICEHSADTINGLARMLKELYRASCIELSYEDN